MIADLPRALCIIERALAGANQRQIAREFCISATRVHQLLQWTVNMLLEPSRLAGEKPPAHDYDSARARRQHADFWRRQIAKARSTDCRSVEKP
jgi:hypothetical protein